MLSMMELHCKPSELRHRSNPALTSLGGTGHPAGCNQACPCASVSKRNCRAMCLCLALPAPIYAQFTEEHREHAGKNAAQEWGGKQLKLGKERGRGWGGLRGCHCSVSRAAACPLAPAGKHVSPGARGGLQAPQSPTLTSSGSSELDLRQFGRGSSSGGESQPARQT